MTRYSFPDRLRVRSKRDFQRVHESKVYASDAVLVLRAAANDRDYPRLGLAIGRVVGNAVVRNRWKRLIREAFRLNQHQLPGGIDLVVRPRKGAEPDLARIQESLRALATRVRRQLSRSERTP